MQQENNRNNQEPSTKALCLYEYPCAVAFGRVWPLPLAQPYRILEPMGYM